MSVQSAKNKKSSEMIDVTLAKGVGIFLVVAGHLAPSGGDFGNDWYDAVLHIIYMFHMPFFMAISGYVFFRVSRIEQINAGYGRYVLGQAKRLLVPFFMIGLLVLFGKMMMDHFVHVDNVPRSFTGGLKGLFYETWHSPSTFIWYVYVLFMYKVFTPLWFKRTGYSMRLAFALALILYVVPPIEYFYLDKLLPYFIFFVYGCFLRKYKEIYLASIDRYGVIYGAAFIASIVALYNPDLPEYTHIKLIVGGLSMPALHALCRAMVNYKNTLQRGIYAMGQSSYYIYLYNLICIGLVKAVMFKFWDWHGVNFYYFVPVLVISGIIGPMVIERIFALRHYVFAHAKER